MRHHCLTRPATPALLVLTAVALLLAGCDGGAAERGAADESAADGGAADGLDGAGRLAGPPVALSTLPSPAPAGSAEPNLTAGPGGFYLSWLERREDGRHALRFATIAADILAAGTGAAARTGAAEEPGSAAEEAATERSSGEAPSRWSEPRTILERDDLFVNWADFPSLLALDDGTLAAHWLQKSGPGTYAYDVRTAVSTDGGATWSDDVIPHRDGEQAEHGFVSLFPARSAAGPDGTFGAVWLDGRETVRGEPMTLRFTTLGANGAAPETLLDAGVCDCCQTAAAVAADGPVVLYRDRTEDEIRDIYVVRQVGGEWTEPAPVHRDGWKIDACPVNGPAVDADGRTVVAAWFTGAEPEGARVLVAFSDDGGASFGEPVRLDDGGAMGRVDVLLLDDGSALASWVERGEEGAGILLRRVAPDRAGRAMQLESTSPERASGFPRMARIGDRVLFAWTEAGGSPRVRTAIGRITDASGRVASGPGGEQ